MKAFVHTHKKIETEKCPISAPHPNQYLFVFALTLRYVEEK